MRVSVKKKLAAGLVALVALAIVIPSFFTPETRAVPPYVINRYVEQAERAELDWNGQTAELSADDLDLLAGWIRRSRPISAPEEDPEPAATILLVAAGGTSAHFAFCGDEARLYRVLLHDRTGELRSRTFLRSDGPHGQLLRRLTRRQAPADAPETDPR
ncbi:MAG: hypothetical protein ACOC8E_00940 [Planctomycetota bacterium]